MHSLEYHMTKTQIWITAAIGIKKKKKRKKKRGPTVVFIREHWKDKKDCKARQ